MSKHCVLSLSLSLSLSIFSDNDDDEMFLIKFHLRFCNKVIFYSCDFQSKEMLWDVKRSFPPVRSCLFSQSLTIITFLGDPSAGAGLPRGTMVFANQPIPKEVSQKNKNAVASARPRLALCAHKNFQKKKKKVCLNQLEML